MTLKDTFTKKSKIINPTIERDHKNIKRKKMIFNIDIKSKEGLNMFWNDLKKSNTYFVFHSLYTYNCLQMDSYSNHTAVIIFTSKGHIYSIFRQIMTENLKVNNFLNNSRPTHPHFHVFPWFSIQTGFAMTLSRADHYLYGVHLYLRLYWRELSNKSSYLI